MLLMIVGNVFGLPITVLLGFFEGFRLLTGSDQDFDRKYNGGYVQRANPRIEKRREEQMRRYESEDKGKPYENAPQQRPLKTRTNPFKTSGLEKYKEFDLDGAIIDFQQGLDIDPNDVSLNFNIACAYSLSEKKDLAYKHLAKAVSCGFNDFERILTHDDLAFVRIQPEFDAFRASGFKSYTSSSSASKTNNETSSNQSPIEEVQGEMLLSQLSRLAELKERGILTEEEFVIEKRKLTRNS
jgi:tetratricopeptide (TPR) repeat protein